MAYLIAKVANLRRGSQLDIVNTIFMQEQCVHLKFKKYVNLDSSRILRIDICWLIEDIYICPWKFLSLQIIHRGQVRGLQQKKTCGFLTNIEHLIFIKFYFYESHCGNNFQKKSMKTRQWKHCKSYMGIKPLLQNGLYHVAMQDNLQNNNHISSPNLSQATKTQFRQNYDSS